METWYIKQGYGEWWADTFHKFWTQVAIEGLLQVIELCETTMGFHPSRELRGIEHYRL